MQHGITAKAYSTEKNIWEDTDLYEKVHWELKMAQYLRAVSCDVSV